MRAPRVERYETCISLLGRLVFRLLNDPHFEFSEAHTHDKACPYEFFEEIPVSLSEVDSLTFEHLLKRHLVQPYLQPHVVEDVLLAEQQRELAVRGYVDAGLHFGIKGPFVS